MPQELTVDLRPFGPDPAALLSRSQNLLAHRAMRRALQRTRHQLLSVEPIEPEEKVARPRASDRFRATIYDYTNNRTLLADGSLRDPDRLEVTESGVQPVPTPEEFAEAVAVLERHRELGPALRRGRLRPYEPMPPLIFDDDAGGGLERVLAVGLLPSEGARGHEIVGVNMGRRRVFRFRTGLRRRRRPTTRSAASRMPGSRPRRRGQRARCGSP